MFFEILGWIFLIILCVVAYFGWKFYRFFKRQTNSDLSLAMSVLPAQDMELEPSNVEEWQERERLAFNEAELKKIGARHLGYYCVYSGYAIIKVSIWDVKSKAAAVIYEACSSLDEKTVTFMFEVASKFKNGSVCVTTNPSVSYSNRPQNHIAVHKDSNSIITLLNAIKSTVPADKKLLKINDPIEFFLECYQDTTEFAWRKEQLESDITQQTLSSVGVNITEELMEELVEIGISYAVEVYTEKARKKLAKHSKMTAEKWERIRDQLIIVNEKMQVDHLLGVVYEVLGDCSESQDQVMEGFQMNTKELVDPIAAFQMLAQSLNLNVKRLVKLDEPVRTEIYLPLN